MVDELGRIARENNASRITAVRLKIGRRSGIVVDSLRFAFDAVKLDYPLLRETRILIDEVPSIFRCNECDRSFENDDIYFPSCPACSSFNLTVISGEEQHIANVELEV
jgi:hydrogenase nickel incorporation protein HypA/HybF